MATVMESKRQGMRAKKSDRSSITSGSGGEASSLEAAGSSTRIDSCEGAESVDASLGALAAAQAVALPSPSDRERNEASDSGRQESLRSELANIPLFDRLDPSSLHMLIRRVRVVRLEAGQILFRQGDPANSLYVVVEGAVVPIAEGPRRRKLAVLERGAFFGEIGLLTKEPRNATVESLVDSELLAIDRRVLWELIEKQPTLAKDILGFLRARLVDRQIRTHLFFEAFPHAEREDVARLFRVLEVNAGDVVVERGKPPEGLLVVLSGRLKTLDPSTGDPIAIHGIGSMLGGIQLVDGRAAESNIVADGKCWLFVLGEARFRRIVDENPRLLRVLHRLEDEALGEAGASSDPSSFSARRDTARQDLITAR